MGKLWEDHGKIMGKLWEDHGKIMGISYMAKLQEMCREIVGKYITQENRKKTQENTGESQENMEDHGKGTKYGKKYAMNGGLQLGKSSNEIIKWAIKDC